MDATKYAKGGNYLKKADLRRDGPQTLTIAAVTETASLPDMKGTIWPVLELTFTDGRKFTLSADINRARVVQMHGADTDAWTGKRITIYFNPDIRNPKGGEAGGLRVQEPDPDEYGDEVEAAADLGEDEPEPEPEPEAEAAPAPVQAPRSVSRPAAVTGRRPS